MTAPRREYHYRVDREGRLLHEGSEIVDPAVLRLFWRTLHRTEDGRWLSVCQGERNWVEADETPFVVQRLRPSLDEAGRLVSAELVLLGDYREPLDPASLAVGPGGLLTCAIRSGSYRARLGRRAALQLAPYLVERDGRVFLTMGGRAHQVVGADHARDLIGESATGLPNG
ncbi:MAG: DUF1285 domain-containing protein [Candidatus Rokubacteria bacterium]|nr:DUF1285 domain-containing protein [Candidatus Rokubacteria bacterium]